MDQLDDFFGGSISSVPAVAPKTQTNVRYFFERKFNINKKHSILEKINFY